MGSLCLDIALYICMLRCGKSLIGMYITERRYESGLDFIVCNYKEWAMYRSPKHKDIHW
jgi:hypothetical protein